MITAEAAVDTAFYVVTRPLFAGGLDRHEGEVVDGSQWRGVERLCEQRYMRRMLHDDPKPVSSDGRMFIDNDHLLAYADALVSPVETVTTLDEAQQSAILNFDMIKEN